MAKDLAIDRLIPEVDSEVVVSSLRSDPEPCNPNYYLILQCRVLLVRPDWEVMVKHTSIEKQMM